jgi:hypothetical protein
MTTADLSRLAAERRAAMENIFIETPRTREAHQKFKLLIDHAAVSQRNKMCVLLVAPSQSGKTKVIEMFLDEMNTDELLNQRTIPVLHVTLHAQVTRKGLAQDILLALQSHGYETGAGKGGEQELWARVFRYLTVAGVKLLVLDEVQHVKTSSVAMAHSVGDMIKGALNNGPCPIVLSGVQTAELPFKVNTQLQQRAIPSIVLSRFRPDIPSDVELFGDFLVEYLMQVDDLGVTENGCELLGGDVPACILEVSRGVLGAACRLLMEAVTTMTLNGRSRLIVDDLTNATDNAFLRAGLHDRNPFRTGLGPLRDYDAAEAAVRLAHASA